MLKIMSTIKDYTLFKFISILIILILLTVCFEIFSISKSLYIVNKVYVLKIDSTITQYTSDLISKTIIKLEKEGNSILILILNTPGGLLEATFQIMQNLLKTKIITIGFVYPTGSYAWSAGTFILLSTHIAAMARGTVIGSCQPVYVTPEGKTIPVNQSKIVNALIKYFEEALRVRNRNLTFAKLCIEKNLNLGAEEALKYHVINVIANDIHELLTKINLTKVNNKTLLILNPNIINIRPGLSYSIYSTLTRQEISSILMTIGFLLILIAAFTGFAPLAIIGIVLIILPLLLAGLPINWIGLTLLILGVAFIIGEILSGAATHGIALGMGIVLSIIGIIFLLPTYYPPEKWLIRPNPTLIQAILYTNISLGLGFGVFYMYNIIKVKRRKPISEKLFFNMIGKRGVAIEDIKSGNLGYVKIEGEYWKVKASEDISKGDEVEVINIEQGIPIIKKVKH